MIFLIKASLLQQLLYNNRLWLKWRFFLSCLENVSFSLELSAVIHLIYYCYFIIITLNVCLESISVRLKKLDGHFYGTDQSVPLAYKLLHFNWLLQHFSFHINCSIGSDINNIQSTSNHKNIILGHSYHNLQCTVQQYTSLSPDRLTKEQLSVSAKMLKFIGVVCCSRGYFRNPHLLDPHACSFISAMDLRLVFNSLSTERSHMHFMSLIFSYKSPPRFWDHFRFSKTLQ